MTETSEACIEKDVEGPWTTPHLASKKDYEKHHLLQIEEACNMGSIKTLDGKVTSSVPHRKERMDGADDSNEICVWNSSTVDLNINLRHRGTPFANQEILLFNKSLVPNEVICRDVNNQLGRASLGIEPEDLPAQNTLIHINWFPHPPICPPNSIINRRATVGLFISGCTNNQPCVVTPICVER